MKYKKLTDWLSVAATIVLVTLKLADVINWSWFWVISPFIFGFLLNGLRSAIIYKRNRRKGLSRQQALNSVNNALDGRETPTETAWERKVREVREAREARGY